jgi:serine/threonine protein kinase
MADRDDTRADPPGPRGPDTDRLRAALTEFERSYHSGSPIDPEEFCRTHADCGPGLREAIAEFLSQGGSTGVAGERVLGDYRILREIGRGGMGVVYEAEQISLKRRVALKVLLPHLTITDAVVLKFRREAEAGGRQSHPGIVSVYAVGEHEGAHYIAQELVEGGRTFADRLGELRAGVDPSADYCRQTARLFAEVADALADAHATGVIHRDVKPSNILLTREGAPKITDFGLAKMEDALALTRTGEFEGTPYYVSPEQVMRKPGGLDHRTDIYSLGVTLYEALTLSPPFGGQTTLEVLKAVVGSEPVDPQKVRPGVPRDLAVICLKAMEKEPSARYATMGDFAADLRRWFTGEPILAQVRQFDPDSDYFRDHRARNSMACRT